MITDAECLQLAALLHDIGKFRQRKIAQRPYGTHGNHGWEFVTKDFKGFFYSCGDELGDAILHHHQTRNTKEIEKQVILADWLSAKERETEEREREQPSHTPLVSIMSRLKGGAPKDLRYNLSSLEINREGIFPTAEGAQANPEMYTHLWEEFTQELQRLAGERAYQSADFHTLVALLHKYTVRMPAATPWEGQPERTIPDVSLYDHLRTTAAIAACIYHEVLPDELNGYLHHHRERPLCALIKGDISGIQNFLYQIPSEGASRELRGRSFYLQLLTEAIAFWMLRKFNLPITNLILASGGHFYLLAPYTRAKEELDALRAEITEKLWRLHQDDLSIILAGVSITARNLEDFSKKWGIVTKEVDSRKQKKWSELPSEKMYDYFFNPHPDREMNYGFEELGKVLRAAKYQIAFEIPDQPMPETLDWCDAMRAFGLEIYLIDALKDKPRSPDSASRAIVYTLKSTDFLTSESLQFQWPDLPVSYDFRLLPQVIATRHDRDEVADFDYLAQASQGAEWLGALRMDVDNLGNLFKDGLGESATISRVSTLSESLRLFFEGYIPHFCHEYNANQKKQLLELIYAGGDDLFLVGGWSALPEVAKNIRDKFREFVGGDHVTLSGSIAIEHQKYPLYQFADNAGEALEKAKDLRKEKKDLRKEKDAINFLRTPMTWEQFHHVHRWHHRLLVAMTGKDPLPHNFLTRLSEIYSLKMGDKNDQRKWAWRLIYHLSRAKQMHKNHSDLIDDLRQELVVNHGQDQGLIQLIHVIARWTALQTRED